MCDSKELIVGYLYDDLTDPERRSFDAHMAVCGECRDELIALRATRAHLALWSPPLRDLGIRVVREEIGEPGRVLPMRARWNWTAAFGLAAAAVLVLAAATAIANLEVRYDANGFAVRTGWARSSDVPAQVQTPSTTAVAVPASDFARLEQRLRELERSLQSSAGAVQVASGPRISDAEIFRRVREIVGEAESRQQTVLSKRLIQVVQDFDRQRQSDLAAIQHGLGTYQGLTNAEIATQRDMLNQLYRVAARQEK
ncbi:MAG: zf-HC2 domain-containing protein [Vicinamibacterales bacterium]